MTRPISLPVFFSRPLFSSPNRRNSRSLKFRSDSPLHSPISRGSAATTPPRCRDICASSIPRTRPGCSSQSRFAPGELYETTELTRDGALPKFSPGGKYIAVRNGTDRQRTSSGSSSSAEPTRTIVELRGSGASFNPTARSSPTGRRQQRRLQPRRPPRQQRRRGTPAAAKLRGAALYDIATAQETALDTGELTQSASCRWRRRHRALLERASWQHGEPDHMAWLLAGRSRRSRPTRPTRSSPPSTRRALPCSSRPARREQAAAGVARHRRRCSAGGGRGAGPRSAGNVRRAVDS